MSNTQTIQAAQQQFLLENSLEAEYRAGFICDDEYQTRLQRIFDKIVTIYGV